MINNLCFTQKLLSAFLRLAHSGDTNRLFVFCLLAPLIITRGHFYLEDINV